MENALRGIMNTVIRYYKLLLEQYARSVQAMKECPSEGSVLPEHKNAPSSKTVLIFSPHPDDESIIGALPIRLARELNYKIVNVAVTLGSKKERQLERLNELKNACSVLGFDLVATGERCLEHVNELERGTDSAAWNQKVGLIGEIITQYQPACVIVPHRNDGHITHMGTHLLVLDALQQIRFPTFVCLTEFWRALKEPNLMIESSIDDVALMMAALSCHVGEIKRNQYHAFLPAWMTDNVRRGSELLDGAGAAAANIAFATLYHWLWFDGCEFASGFHKNRIMKHEDSLSQLFGRDGMVL